MILLLILLSFESSIIIKCFFYFVGFQWIVILDVFGWLYFEVGSNISNKLVFEVSFAYVLDSNIS